MHFCLFLISFFKNFDIEKTFMEHWLNAKKRRLVRISMSLRLYINEPAFLFK